MLVCQPRLMFSQKEAERSDLAIVKSRLDTPATTHTHCILFLSSQSAYARYVRGSQPAFDDSQVGPLHLLLRKHQALGIRVCIWIIHHPLPPARTWKFESHQYSRTSTKSKKRSEGLYRYRSLSTLRCCRGDYALELPDIFSTWPNGTSFGGR